MVKATGIEKAFCSEWEGWDGDQESLQFYRPKITSLLAAATGINRADVLELDLINGKLALYNFNEDTPLVTKEFELTIKE